ncbi:MAG TPA: aspartate-semialdehyde dehydrogenase [Planctomycetota bacterium]|nr:aspartate-semialdehyde dehydrogenase [Planctomycetota bacterium]
MPKGFNVSIIGATGAVGLKFLECLEKRKFPVRELRAYASERSEGKVVHFAGKPIRVRRLTGEAFEQCDIALFSAGSGVSKEWAPVAAKKGSIVVDNSSAWRMDPEVPLVVPEVNPQEIRKHKGIIANPNCSTIQMVVALKPIHDQARIRRVVVSTYQAVSGAGGRALEELREQIVSSVQGDGLTKPKLFPRQIAYNAIPMIPQKDAFVAEGYTVEEQKMVQETKKIMGDPSIQVCATCVRVPVRTGHSESVNIEMDKPLSAQQAVELLRKAPGVIVSEKQEDFPTPFEIEGKGEVFVGRIRRDPTVKNGLAMWVVADNLLKGAALNAVQIAEHLAQS